MGNNNNTANRLQNIISVVLLIILLISISFDIYHFINPSHKVSEIDVRLAALEKLIYDIGKME